MDDKMTNVYQFPNRKPSAFRSPCVKADKSVGRNILFRFRILLATVLHVIFLTPFLIVLRFRMPVFVLSAAYSLNFFFSHGHSFWTATDFTAVYTTAAVCAVALVGPFVGFMERSKPIHTLFNVKG
ncbi:hypothetical protein QE443_004721 [Pantoea ananatis]|uniref:hypothetical protein n=1 Tax=Pantoea ananas TaxID=553 RepID=UPI0027854473|nr:hypothetical protein [Pantoea ananatis]MDQ1228460.1 hypothetical protein [Pantoea ananatis]